MEELIGLTKADAKRFRHDAERDRLPALYERERAFYARRAQ